MTFIQECLKTSAQIKDGRTRLHSLSHAAEELGEVSAELRIEEGRSSKEQGEGVIGEAIDLIVCATDLIYLSNPNITEADLQLLLRKKLDKWIASTKTEEKITMTYPVFLGIFTDAEHVIGEFSERYYSWDEKPAKPSVPDEEILFAYYSYEDYSGHAFVLFRMDGKLYEVNGSHCSCYGLEDQWDPEETSVKLLRDRMDKGHLGYYYSWDSARNSEFADELRAVLNTLEEEGFQ